MHETWRDRLSEYLDGELMPSEHEELERHLAACAECRAAVEELRQVVERARGLENRQPERELWTGIAERLETTTAVVDLAERGQRRKVSFSIPQLLAAGITLMMVTAGGVWLALSPRSETTMTTAQPMNAPAEPAAVLAAMPGFNAAVADLQLVLTERRDVLDSTTVRVLEENLAVIDRAIEEAWEALERDPANAYLNQHLAENMWRKVRLLRQVAAIATAAS
ncbi:MAG: zf-HC2 domain-containing protein [Gemmatimonadota bacterium]